MEANNRFANYLINDHCLQLYSMRDESNLWDFINLFLGRLLLFSENGQGELPIICSTLYYSTKGKYIELPCSLIRGRERYRKGIYTPGDLVWNDLFSDALFFKRGNSWCLPQTFDVMHDIDIVLKTVNVTLSFRLRMVDDGFVKFSQKWEWNVSLVDEGLYYPFDNANPNIL